MLTGCGWGTTGALAAEAAGEDLPVLAPREQVLALDLEGRSHRLPAAQGRPGTVLVFLGVECPIAQHYIPLLNRLAGELAEKQLDLLGVVADPSLEREAAVAFARNFKVEFPLLFDASLDLAERLEPTHTPEAFLLDASGRIVYRGRIDDAYAALGRPRPAVTRHDLREAVLAFAAGRAPAPRATQPVGCRFEALETQRRDPAPTSFCRDIAPILWSRCIECHRAGEVAPFPLTSYQDAAKRAGFLVDVARSGYMPPWKPQRGFGSFVGERALTEREIERLAEWQRAGAPEGNRADLPPLPEFRDGWQLGEPDLVIEMPEPFLVPAEGPDIFRWFALPVTLPADVRVGAVEFRPGCRRVVHHLITFLDLGRGAQRLDQADPEPGYDNLGGPGIVPMGSLGSWGPGVTPHPFPEGTAITLPRRSTIALQAHYRPSGKPELDQTQIGLYFSRAAKPRAVTIVPIINAAFTLEPGNRAQRVTATFELPVALGVIGLIPHMHYLGREMTAVARLPDGQTVPLIRIADWDFNWQDQYRLNDELRLPAGTRIEVEAIYDNSADNPRNPHSPPQRVSYGQKATDEMLILGMHVTLDKTSDFIPLAAALVRTHAVLRDGRLVILPLE